MQRPKRSQIWKISKEELRRIVSEAESFGQVLYAFGLNNKGGNVRTLKTRLIQDDIDFSHIPSGRGSNRIRMRGGLIPIPLESVLVEGSNYNRGYLKKRLIEQGILQNRCALCGEGPRWNGLPLTLVLDHINGVSTDNRLENLRLLCPNCNSQTETFAGRRRKYSAVV